jgi:hypothetical protein
MPFTTLLVDTDVVVLTNGWGGTSIQRIGGEAKASLEQDVEEAYRILT